MRAPVFVTITVTGKGRHCSTSLTNRGKPPENAEILRDIERRWSERHRSYNARSGIKRHTERWKWYKNRHIWVQKGTRKSLQNGVDVVRQ